MKSKFTTGLIFFVCAVTIITFNLSPPIEIRGQSLLTPPSASVRYFTFGYDETVGDSFWLRAIQQFSSCEQKRGGTAIAPSGAQMGIDRTPSCVRGWLYHMLDLILDIIPRFKYAARVGPVVLSVIVDDVEGATYLFEKAMRNFPDDWVIKTRAAYHYVFEVEDYSRGGQLYFEAAKLGAPNWMVLYASKLADKDGRKSVAYNMISQFLKDRDLNEKERALFSKKLKALEK